MEAVAADRKLLIRTSFVGSLLFVAGICTQLYLCGYSVLRFINLPAGEKKSYKFYLSIMLLILASTLVAFVVDCITKIDNFTNYAWITGMNESAIPLTPAWVVAVGVGTLGLIHLIGDALLAWRCYIIWTHNRKIGLIPVIPYIALLGIGLTYLASAGKTAKLESSQTPNGPRPFFKYQAATFFLSVGVNMLSTTLICIRLGSMARTIRRIADSGNGPDLMSATSSYQRVMTILIESALPFAFFSLACAVVSYIRVGKPDDIGAFSAYRITYPLWTVSVGLAPQLIIFRVINGNSWVSNPTIQETRATNIQSIRFATRPESQDISMDARKGPRWQEASSSKAATSLA